MNGGQLPINQLHDINWGALDHASRVPQLVSYITTLYLSVTVTSTMFRLYMVSACQPVC